MADPRPPHVAASKLAQLLGEVIVHHAPWTAGIAEDAKRERTKDWLEGLEEHLSGLIGPIFARVLEQTDPPPEVRALIEDVISPTAEFGGIVETLFTWGVAQAIISVLLTPFLQELSNTAETGAVGIGISRPVDPATIATAAARGLNLGDRPTVTMPDWAYSEAAKSGVDRADIDLQASIVGLPPALQELFELFRRGVITLDQVKTGLKEGDFRDDWVDIAVQLAHSWLSPLDFVRAAVQKQMDYGDARDWAKKTGLDVETDLPVDVGSTGATADMFGLAYSIAGRPPGPEMLGRMANRGIIGWAGEGADQTTFQQGVAESDVKTKWTAALKADQVYLPPPGTVTNLLEHGGLTRAQAEQYWQAYGVPPELASAYGFIATQQHISQSRLLARSDVLTGFYDGIFDAGQATGMLGDLGYEGDVAREMLAVQSFRREIAAINRVVTRVEGLYGGHRITATVARDSLVKVGIDPAQAAELLRTWEALREQPIRVPTVREIGRAVKYGTLTEQQALTELHDLGYEDRDAAIVLSTYAEAAVKPLPKAGGTITG